MIPASYLYKDVYTRSWGDPRNMQPEATEDETRGPSKGHRAGLAGIARLLPAILPLEGNRRRKVRHA